MSRDVIKNLKNAGRETGRMIVGKKCGENKGLEGNRNKSKRNDEMKRKYCKNSIRKGREK